MVGGDGVYLFVCHWMGELVMGGCVLSTVQYSRALVDIPEMCKG